MNNQLPLKEWVKEIRLIYNLDPSKAEGLIEEYLTDRLKDIPLAERIGIMKTLASHFGEEVPQGEGTGHVAPAGHKEGGARGEKTTEEETAVQRDSGGSLDKKIFSELGAVLLGQRVTQADLSSQETLEKLAKSLDTLFNKLNELIRVIHFSFLGFLGGESEIETIRYVIGSTLEENAKPNSLESYIDQIKKAFLDVHKAFQSAIEFEVTQILNELDPNRIGLEANTGISLAPMKKARAFEIYNEKYEKCKKWFEAGRFMEDLLREFEKSFKKLYIHEKGEV